jgi:hypothetical protein
VKHQRRDTDESGQRFDSLRTERGIGAQLREHRTRFDGGQLVLVTQENDARVLRYGFDEVHRQCEIEHRGFVDDQDVDRKLIGGVVAKLAVDCAAEQAMDGGGVRRKLGAQGVG